MNRIAILQLSQQFPLLDKLLASVSADHDTLARTDYTTANALNRLIRMYPPADATMLRDWNLASRSDQEAYLYIKSNPNFLRTLLTRISKLMPIPPTASQAPANTVELQSTFSFITWNVRGIHNKAQVISKALKISPLIAIFTETHLLPSENHSKYIAGYMPGYSLYASSHAQPNLISSMPRNPIDANGCVLPIQRGHARRSASRHPFRMGTAPSAAPLFNPFAA